MHALEHVSFFTAGALMWATVIEVLPGPEWFGTGAKMGYIVAVRIATTILGNVFVWAGVAVLQHLRAGPAPVGPDRGRPTRASPGA